MNGAKGETGATPGNPPAGAADSRSATATPAAPAAPAAGAVRPAPATSAYLARAVATPPGPAQAAVATVQAPVTGAGVAPSTGATPTTVAKPAAAASSPTEEAPAAPGRTPFWRRAPKLLLFPLQRRPLLFNIASAFAATALAYILIDPNLPLSLASLGVLLLVFCAGTFVVGTYAYTVIEHTATGYLDSRAYPPSRQAVDVVRAAKVFALLVGFPVAVGVLASFLPPIIGKCLWLLVSLVLPAMTIVMIQTDSFAEVLDPSRCLKAVLAIGAPYLLLCLVLLVADLCVYEIAANGARAVTRLPPLPPPDVVRRGVAPVIRHESLSMGSFSAFFLGLGWLVNYLLVLANVLLGYAMFQYSEALGVEVVGPGESRAKGATSAATHARRQREALIAKMVTRGEVAEAIGLVNNDLGERPTDIGLHARLHELLLVEGSGPKIEAHATRFLDLLMAASNTREGLALYEKTRAQFPTFTPREPAGLPLLAREALAAGRPDVAAELVRGFDKRYPAHPQIPDAYVIGARVLLQGGQPEQAKRLLQHVVATWPATPATAEAKRFLERFDKAASPSQPS